MPGPIVHLIVQQRLPTFLSEVRAPAGRDIANLLRDDPCSPYAYFGSMGPDFLFFSAREYGDAIGKFVNFVFNVYDALEPLIEFYEDNIEPVVDAIEDAITFVDQTLFQGLFGQISATAELLSSTALTAVGSVVTSEIDLFYPFYPKVQLGAPEKDWYWFDFLHYRRTGRFCSTMWNLAAGDKELMRYCVGYAGHIGTDVVGHPYVNSIVGGPFRTHWHRHKLVENWIDAYARNHYSDSNATKKCLKIDPSEDTYIGNSIAGSYYSRLCEFPGKKLPPKLGAMFLKAADLTYNGSDAIDHPVTFSFADLDATYRLWLKWFERSTSLGSAVKPTPVSPPGSATSGLVSDYVSGLPTFPGGGGAPGGGGGGFSILGIFAALFEFAKWLAETIAYTTNWIITHAAQILLLPITEALALVKWLLYQIQKGIYELYDSLRFNLVLGGYLFPEPGDLTKNPWAPAFLNSSTVQLTGGASANFNLYPRKQESHGPIGTSEHHLVYPNTIQELPAAEPMPKPLHGLNPEAFISQGHPFDPFIEKLYECKVPYGSDSSATHFVDSNTWDTPQFGSALHFCARLIGERGMEQLPNFNLDGDRGYGWKTWRVDGVDPATTDDRIESKNPVPVNYIDS